MKFFILTTALLAALPAYSAQYSCIAGRSESINFNLNVEDNQVILKFSKATNAYIASDLNKKSAVLDIETDRSSEAHGWTIYAGNKLVNKTMDEYRHFELKINPSTPKGSAELRGAFSISPRGNALYPSYFSQYDLNCNLTK